MPQERAGEAPVHDPAIRGTAPFGGYRDEAGTTNDTRARNGTRQVRETRTVAPGPRYFARPAAYDASFP